MAVTLAPLPYAYDDLEPVISEETLHYHYDKHHKGYVDKTNALIKGTELDDLPLHDVVLESEGDLFNQAAQAWNHEFYWQCMTPDPMPVPQKLMELIERDFGTFEAFQEEFIQTAASLFGSGWCWLELDAHERLVVTARSNADTPIIYHHKPLLVCDVWEHAYYIDYRNERKRYVEQWFGIVDWKFVASNIVDYYHSLTDACKENSELCDYVEMLQEENEVRS